ncbi:MAG: M20 family metallopeptidase [Clostridiales bacterium]|nr:M20 family metallopeptidase [Clostridiales bacterium]
MIGVVGEGREIAAGGGFMRVQSLPEASRFRDNVDRRYITRLVEELIRIPSVTGQGDAEERAARMLVARMDELRMETSCQRVSAGGANAVGRLPGDPAGPVLILNGHLDVVPAGEGWTAPAFEPVIRDGKIFGRGAADMKGALAAMLGAAKLVHDMRLPLCGTALFSFVCDEEDGNRGVARFLADCPPADFAIVGEPTGMRIAAAHRGVIRYRITTRGCPSHIGRTDSAQNAIYRMIGVLEAVRAHDAALRRISHSLLPPAMLAATVIRGGVKDNMTPGECVVTLDRRLLPGETDRSATDALRAALYEAVPGEPPGIEPYLYMPPGEADTRNGQVDALRTLHREYYGGPAEICGFGATCEQAVFLNHGINTVICGPGNIDQAHTADEWASLDEICDAAGFYAWCIAHAAQLANPTA